MKKDQTAPEDIYIKFKSGCIRGIPIIYTPEAIKSNNSDISII